MRDPVEKVLVGWSAERRTAGRATLPRSACSILECWCWIIVALVWRREQGRSEDGTISGET